MTESPRFSLITVSDDPEYLYLLWKSIIRNEYPTSWEWVIGGKNLNKETSAWQRVVRFAADTPNIHLLDLPPNTPKTPGGWLSALVEFSRGEILIFHDRDMMFTPTTWTELSQIKDVPILVHPNINLETLFDATTLQKTQGPQIWQRGYYLKLNGHHTELENGLDFELLCRAFIAHYEIEHYPAKVFNFNPVKLPEHIQRTINSIANTLFYQLIQQTYERKEGLFGQVIWLEQDLFQKYAAIKWDGSKLIYPDTNKKVKKNSLSILRAQDVLNYLPQNETIAFMQAAWEVLIPEGWLITATVSSRGAGAFADPRSRSYWNNLTFSIFCLEEVNPDFGGRFQYSRVFEHYPAKWHKENQVPYVVADLKKLEV